MKLASLNIKHEKLLNKYVKYLQGVAYEATEFSAPNKFEEFNEILHNIVNYTNAFQKIVKDSKRISEWVYMPPNLMLYACMGFLSGIKDKTNKKLINELSEDLFERTVDFVGETADILDSIKTKINTAEKIKIIQKERNEHNS
tara:strand:- start:1580 stop:2008 length:429 start_codon:yes stop_codon:yes gene_type:complete